MIPPTPALGSRQAASLPFNINTTNLGGNKVCADMAELNSRKWRQKYRSVNVKSLPTGMTFFPEWVSKALHN